MLQNLISIREFRLTKWSFLVHSTTHNAPYIHPGHDLILESWRSFPNAARHADCYMLSMLYPTFYMLLLNHGTGRNVMERNRTE